MRFKRKFYFFCFFFLLGLSRGFALEVPAAPTGRVNDYGGMLDASAKSEIENKLKTFEDQTSTQVVLVTFPSLEGESLEDFSMRLAEKWKIGQKGKDNGIILLIFKNDHKLRIEVGYGLEGVLSDALGKDIIQNDIVPSFKKGNFKEGIVAGLDAIMAATRGEYKVAASADEAPKTFMDKVGDLIVDIIAKIFAFFIVVFFPLFLLYGLLIRPILRFFWPSHFPKWTSGSSYSGGSSGWSSGSSWGGGFGGGGFSGGGGGFGGGGSSGSW